MKSVQDRLPTPSEEEIKAMRTVARYYANCVLATDKEKEQYHPNDAEWEVLEQHKQTLGGYSSGLLIEAELGILRHNDGH